MKAARTKVSLRDTAMLPVKRLFGIEAGGGGLLASMTQRCRLSGKPLRILGLGNGAGAGLGYRGYGRGRTLNTAVYDDAAGAWWRVAGILLEKLEEKPESASRSGAVLSNQACRFLALPWSDALLDRAEATEYSARAFRNAYGERAGEWTIAVQDEGYGRPRLACAVERRAMTELEQTCAARGSRLVFVRPYFSVAFDRFRDRCAADEGVMAVVEPGVLAIGRWQGGAIVDVDVEPCGPNWPAALSAWLVRHALMEECPGEVMVLCPPGLANDGIERAWRLLEWPEEIREVAAEHPGLAMVSCAL